MLISLNQLSGYHLKANDGEIGKVKDFLFDDNAWMIRYLVADTGNWLVDRLVLIPPNPLEVVKWVEKQLTVNMTMEQIEKSPKIEKDKPVSKQRQKQMIQNYGWPVYYSGTAFGVAPVGIPPVVQPRPQKMNIDETAENNDPNLRSMNEVLHYDIEAVDGDIGHVEDLIAEDENWEIMYLVVDTLDYFPGGKKVLCAVDWIKSIDYLKSEVKINLDKDDIKNSPEFNPAEPVNRQYEERLYDFYGRPKYW
jgi:hypothetical protein